MLPVHFINNAVFEKEKSQFNSESEHYYDRAENRISKDKGQVIQIKMD